MRKITLFFAALLISMTAFAANIVGGTKLYLKPGTAWAQGNERFAAYFYGGDGEKWVSMSTVTGASGVYEVEAPSGTRTNVIFCRMNGSNLTNSWDAKWDQTNDLTYDGTKNCYSISSSSNGKGNGSWSTYTPPVVTVPVVKFKNSASSYFVGEKFIPEVESQNVENPTYSYRVNGAIVEITSEGYTFDKAGKYTFEVDVKSNNEGEVLATAKYDVDVICKITAELTIYMTPSDDWKKDGARFAAYFFGLDGELWVDMTDADNDGVYEVMCTGTRSNVIFVRMKGSAATNNWDNKLDQTGDLTYDCENNHYSIVSKTWSKYTPKPVGVKTSWSFDGGITAAESGIVLDKFTNVVVAFSGVDSVGRDVTSVAGQGSSTNILFYEVLADGSLAPVENNGLMYPKSSGTTVTYSLQAKNYKNVETGTYNYLRQGNYRIVIDGDAGVAGTGDILFKPNRSGLPKVYNDQTWTFDFTIKNDYVAKYAQATKYVVVPTYDRYAPPTLLESLSEIIVTFPEYESIVVNATYGDNKTYIPCVVSENGANVEKAQMKWEAVAGTPNAIRIYADNAITNVGTYGITIPEGLVNFKSTATEVVYNESLALSYTVAKKNITSGLKLYYDFSAFENLKALTYAGAVLNDGTTEKSVDMVAVSDGLWELTVPEGSYYHVTINLGTAAEALSFGATALYYDGVNNLHTLKAEAPYVQWGMAEDGDFNRSVYSPEPEKVKTSWSFDGGITVAESGNLVLDKFTNVIVAFSGIDSVGREVTKVVAQGSSTNILFYEVLADGSLTPVEDNGLMYAKSSNKTITYSLQAKNYKAVETDTYNYMKQGNYRIVIDTDNGATTPVGDVLFQPNRSGLPKVYNDQTWTFDFTIKNDYVAKYAQATKYVVVPAYDRYAPPTLLESLSEIVVTFPEYESIVVNATYGDNKTYIPCVVSENGANVEKAQMKWEAVAGTPNAIRIYADNAITNVGTYGITIPEGLVTFKSSATEVVYNESLALSYTVAKKNITSGLKLYYDFSAFENLKALTYAGAVLNDGTTEKSVDMVAVSEGLWELTVPEGSYYHVTINLGTAAEALSFGATALYYDGVNNLHTLKAEAPYVQWGMAEDGDFNRSVYSTKPATVTKQFTYSYTFASTQFSAAGTKTLNNVDWTLTTDAGYFGFDSNNGKGQQIGSGSKPAKSAVLSTTGIEGKITKIVVNTSGASSIAGTFAVTVNGVAYTPESIKLTTSATDYEFTGAETGEIKFTWTQTSSKALYIKSINIEYEKEVAVDAVDAPVFSVEGGVKEEAFNLELTCATADAEIYYTLNGGAETKYTAAINIAATTTVKAWAVKGETRSEEVSATYTFFEYVENATIAQVLAAEPSDYVWYQMTGVIDSLYNTTYGNFNLVNGTEKILVYGLTATKVASNDKSFASLNLKEGDKITIWGTRSAYNGKPQVGGPAYFVEKVVNDTVVVKSVEELKSHAGKLVLFEGIEPVSIKQGWFTNTFLADSVTALTTDLYPVPAKFDAYGTLTEEGFVVDSVVAIHAFNSIGDLASFIEEGATDEQKMAAYEIKEPAIVTLASMFSFYVQYEAQSMWGGASWQGMMVQAGPMSTYMAKAGDAIQLKGSYSPAVYDEEDNLQQPAFFALQSATLVSENNKLNYTSIDPAYIEGYYASLGRLPKGGEIAEDDMGYYYVYSYSDWVENPETNMYDEVIVKDSLQLMIAGPVDLSAYVGVELDKLVAGVADFDPSTGKSIFYVTELQESKLYYDNIAEMIAAGSSDYAMSSVLRNPVLLTYISYNQWAGYTIFVQDSTGAIAIKGLGVETEDGYDFPYDIKPGDMITGVEGHPNVSEGAPYMWSGAEYDIEPNFVKVADGVITPLELTMAEFCADIKALTEAMWEGGSYSPKYANFVVNVKDLNKYVDPNDEKWPWLTNGVDSIQVSTYYWGRIAVPEHIASLTGIADYGVINSNGTPTIQPLDADAVIEQFVEAKNAYAYDVRVEKTDDAVVVSYALNAPAKSVRVIAKAEGEVVATKAGSAVAQVKGGELANVHSVEFAIAELPRKELTFEVEVTGENVEAPALVPVNYSFYHSQGIDVDVNPESEFFGRVYATECMPDGVGGKYHSATKGQALYAFDATLAPIANNEGTYGFTGGLTIDAANKDPRKVRISEDGRVFLTRQALTGVSPLVEVNPADLNANFTDVFVDFTHDAETYELKTADGKFMASPNIAFDVKGQGEDLKVFMLSTTKAGIAYNPRGNYAKEYNLGTAKTWNAEPSATIDALDTLTHYTVNYLGASVEYDNEGGIWYAQYRGTPKETEPSLIHVNAQGVEDYKDFTFVARSSAIRFNNDFSLLAIAGNGGKKCTIFKVEKDADGKPVLNKQYEFAVNGNNVNDMAWDYANNLYIVNSSSELLYMFAMPRESAVVTTPAAARYTVDLALPMEVEFENIAAIYEMGMWDMAYYESYSNYEVKAVLKSQPTVVDKVVTSGMMGGGINNYYLNDGTGVIVLQAEGDRIEPILDENWEPIGYDTIPGLTIEIGKKLPANFFATIDFKTVIDDETYLPTGEVYGAPVMAYVPRETGDTIVEEDGWETIVTESNEDFAARCEASDFVEEAVEVSIDDLLANRIDYAGKLVVVDTTASYYAETMMDHFSGAERTTAYMYWDVAEAFDVESYEEEGVTYVYVSPKFTEDYNNFAGKLFNFMAEELPAAALDANVTVDVAKARFDWNSIAQGQTMIAKEYKVVTPGPGQDVENGELVVNIYSNNGSVYVETEAGAMIEVYTVNGLRVFAGVSNTNTTVINGLNTNIAIIRVNGEAYKVFVK